MIDDLFV